MSKSLEALDNIVVTFDEMGFVPTTSNPNSDFSFTYWFNNEYNTIKKDLERLEQLEIANRNNEKVIEDARKLINRNLELCQEYDTLKKEYDELDLKCIDLLTQNQELKDKLKEPKYKVFTGCRGGGRQFTQHVENIKKENRVKDGMIKFFETEYKKFEKAIEILKEKVSFEVILNLCDDEEKELLNEVLE